MLVQPFDSQKEAQFEMTIHENFVHQYRTVTSLQTFPFLVGFSCWYVTLFTPIPAIAVHSTRRTTVILSTCSPPPTNFYTDRQKTVKLHPSSLKGSSSHYLVAPSISLRRIILNSSPCVISFAHQLFPNSSFHDYKHLFFTFIPFISTNPYSGTFALILSTY